MLAVLDRDRLALVATMSLTFVTGVVDAVGFLALDRVFTGNMTGNIVILGMGVAGADELPVLGPAVALVAFTAAAWVAVAGTGARGAASTPWSSKPLAFRRKRAASAFARRLRSLSPRGATSG